MTSTEIWNECEKWKKTEMLDNVYIKSSVSYSFIHFCFVWVLIFQKRTVGLFVHYAFDQI